MSPLVLTIYLLQTAACVAAALLLLGLWRAYRHEYLRRWGWSWLALGVHEVASAMAFALALSLRDAGHPLRLAVMCASFTAVACQLWWLLEGALLITREFRPSRRVAVATFVGALLAALVIAVLTVDVTPEARRIVRSGVPLTASAGAFLAFFVLMLRSRRPGPRFGRSILGIAALMYAMVEVTLLGSFIYDVRNPVAFPISEFAAVLTLFLQVVMALGMVVWLLDEQRVAASEASAALSTSESRFRRLVDHARLVAWEFNPQTKQFTYVSPQAQMLLGYPLAQWYQPGFWFNHVHPDDRERARAFSREQSHLGREHAYEYRMLRSDGEIVWVRDLTSVERRDGALVALRGVLIDITDRKTVEQDMQRVQERLATVVAGAPLVLWAVDREGRFTLSEGHGLDALGLRAGEVVGRTLEELYADHPHIRQLHQGALKGQTVVESVELNGLVYETRVGPIVDAGGAINGVIGVAVDVTQRHRAQAALQRSEEHLRGLYESAVDPLWDWDVERDVSVFSPSWRRLLGYTDEQFQREHPRWSQLLHADDRDAVLRKLDEALADDRVLYEIEYRLRTRSGSWKWVLSRGRVVTRDAAGRALRMVGSITDITERKQVETALRESEARLRAVIDNAPSVAIEGFDSQGRVLFWNRAAESIFGWSEHEAVGRTLKDLMRDAAGHKEFLETLRQVDRTNQPITMGDIPFTRRDGSSGWCYSTVFKLPSGPASTFICMDVDITGHKQAEEALERSNGLQRLLLSELDHRVRNNLASLSALIDISSRDSRSLHDFADSVRSRVQAMSVVHSLLSREPWQAVDLRQLLVTLAPVGTQDRLDIHGEAVSVASRQATALGMVLQELLANSQKYGALSRAGGTVCVKWALDAGPGDNGTRRLSLEWQERGGPQITAPVRDGVGTGLIHGLVRAELQGQALLSFTPEGATHKLLLALDAGESVASNDSSRQVASTPV